MEYFWYIVVGLVFFVGSAYVESKRTHYVDSTTAAFWGIASALWPFTLIALVCVGIGIGWKHLFWWFKYRKG